MYLSIFLNTAEKDSACKLAGDGTDIPRKGSALLLSSKMIKLMEIILNIFCSNIC